MEEKTIGMIRFIKHNVGNYPTLREAAIAYMMNYSGCESKEVYENGKIEGIVREIVFDFIDAVDKPSTILRQLAESRKIHCEYLHEEFSEDDAMLTAMMLVPVRDDFG